MKISRRGGMFDLFMGLILAFILAICLVLFTYAQNQVEEKLLEVAPTIQKSFTNETNVTEVILNTVGKVTQAYSSFKWISVMLIFGFFLSILISSFLVRANRTWFIAYVFVVIICTIVSVYISNTYEDIMMNETLAETFLTGFFAQNWIFLNLPIWIIVVGMVSGILMYINLDTGGFSG